MRYISIIVFFVFISACKLGKREVEEDKFPEWSEFPNIKNKKVVIDSLPYEFINLKHSDSFIFSHCIEQKAKSNENLNFFIVFNQSFEIIEKVRLKRDFTSFSSKNKEQKTHLTFKRLGDNIYVKEENSEFLYVFNLKTLTLNKINSLLSNKEFLKRYNVLHDTLKKEYLFGELVNYKSDCVLKLDTNAQDTYIPILNNSCDFFISLNVSSSKELKKKENTIVFCGEDLHDENNKVSSLRLIGEAVLGNNSSGNHYYFYYVPYGYKYYSIITKNINFNFKFNSSDLDSENLKHVTSYENQLFLLNSGKGKIYRVKTNMQ